MERVDRAGAANGARRSRALGAPIEADGPVLVEQRSRTELFKERLAQLGDEVAGAGRRLDPLKQPAV